MSTEILGIGIDDLTLREATDAALSLMAERRGAYICTPNPEMLWLAQRDLSLYSALCDADLRLPDGVGDLLAARILQKPLRERVSGIDFACALMSGLRGSVYLLGARPGVAERAAANVGKRWPNVRVVGCTDGYYTDENAVIARICAAKPDFLFVCLGMRRQELFMQKLAGCPDIGLMVGLGGTLDVLAGDVKRAPAWCIRLGLEWLYRFVRQPWRIKRFLRLPLFLAAVVKQKVKEWAKEN